MESLAKKSHNFPASVKTCIQFEQYKKALKQRQLHIIYVIIESLEDA